MTFRRHLAWVPTLPAAVVAMLGFASGVHAQRAGQFDLMWSLGLWDHLAIFMDIPYHFIVKPSGHATDVLGGTLFQALLPGGKGLGDLYVGARGNLYGTRDNVFQIALQATMTVNTASLAASQQNYRGIRSWPLRLYRLGDDVKPELVIPSVPAPRVGV